MRDTFITITLNKEDFLHKYPDIFSQLRWVSDKCVIKVWCVSKNWITVTSFGVIGFIDIPTKALEKYLTN